MVATTVTDAQVLAVLREVFPGLDWRLNYNGLGRHAAPEAFGVITLFAEFSVIGGVPAWEVYLGEAPFADGEIHPEDMPEGVEQGSLDQLRASLRAVLVNAEQAALEVVAALEQHLGRPLARLHAAGVSAPRAMLAKLTSDRARMLAPIDAQIADLRAVVQAEEDAVLLADPALTDRQRAALIAYTGDWNQRHIGEGLTVDQVIDDPRNEPGYYIRVALTERGVALRAALLRCAGRSA